MPNKERKKANIAVSVFLILFIIVGVPLSALTITYFTSENFQYLTNEFMSGLPLGIGVYFDNLPTREEKEEIKLQIAAHYILMETDRIVDKLTIIKKEDHQLFNDLLLIMDTKSTHKMHEVNEILRASALEGNILQRTLQEIYNDEIIYVDEMIEHITSMSVSLAVKEIEKFLNSGKLNDEQLALMFKSLDIEVAGEYLIYLDDSITLKIMRSLPTSIGNDLEKTIAALDEKHKNLQEIADIYAKGSIIESANDLSDIEKYNINELAIIFLQMDIAKAAEILASTADNEFVFSLFNAIDEREALNSLLFYESKNFSINLAQAIEAFRNYETRLNELSRIYEKMEPDEIAALMSQMLRNNIEFKEIVLSNGERISFNEEKLVIDILNNFEHTLVADILGELDTRAAVELSQRLIIKP